jgi:hypothetical protein
MSATVDKIIEEFHSLPPEEQQRFREMPDREARTAELRRIQNKYKDANVSSDAFAAEKAAEIARETTADELRARRLRDGRAPEGRNGRGCRVGTPARPE